MVISGNKVVDDGNMAILDGNKITMYADTNVFVLVKGKPILIGKQDKQGQFRVSLVILF